MVCEKRSNHRGTISRRRLIRFIVVGGCQLFGCFVFDMGIVVFVTVVIIIDVIIRLVIAIVLGAVSNAVIAAIVQM